MSERLPMRWNPAQAPGEHEANAEEEARRNRSPTERAQLAIARILRDLEAETDSVVESVALVRYDTTTIACDGPQHLIRVVVELMRPPGHDWVVE